MIAITSDTIEQRAGSRLKYSLDWSALAGGAALAAAVWSVPVGSPVTVTADPVAGTSSTAWVVVPAGTPSGWHEITATAAAADGSEDTRVIALQVQAVSGTGSALFPSKAAAIATLRRDRLMMLAAGVLSEAAQLSDDYLWEKLLAAESAIAGQLSVRLQPTHFFPRNPTDAQIAALPAGMPWDVDPGYDYDPSNYHGDRWGYTVLRWTHVNEVHDLKLVYPSPSHTVLEVPASWIRVDKRPGHLQLVPTSSPFLSPIGGLVMASMAGGRMLPFSIEVEYTAGLKDAAKTYPELVSAVKMKAVAGIIDDAMLPQSGSISADGLSQSSSVDTSKYHDTVDGIINGTGSNGGLMVKLHGVRLMVC
jgi:hypothetical protein